MTAITGSEGDTTDQDFAYDYENRLLGVADSAATKDYAYGYDYRTRRALRDESLAGGASTSVSFSGGTSAREYDGGSSTPTVEFVRGSDYGGGIGGILYTLRSGTPSFKHYNSRGDVVAATDGTGTLTYQAAYEAFARHGDTPSSEEWGSTADRQQGNTKDEDGWGALNEGFRYRLLDEGVFMTPDPLGFVDGPNVYTYVVQNPWTKFDPLGLKFDDKTFDSDNDRAYNWDELGGKEATLEQREEIQDRIKGADWFAGESRFNQGVNNFNENLEKLTETPFGSAQYEYLKKADQEFSFSFGEDGGSSGSAAASFNSNGDKAGGRFHFNTGKEVYGRIAHEFTHGIQNIGDLTHKNWGGDSGSPFTSLIDSSDSSKYIPHGRTPQWKEAQAQRAKNIVNNEYGLQQAGNPNASGFIKYRYSGASVDDIIKGGEFRGSPHFGTQHYGDPATGFQYFKFNNPSGTYKYDHDY